MSVQRAELIDAHEEMSEDVTSAIGTRVVDHNIVANKNSNLHQEKAWPNKKILLQIDLGIRARREAGRVTSVAPRTARAARRMPAPRAARRPSATPRPSCATHTTWRSDTQKRACAALDALARRARALSTRSLSTRSNRRPRAGPARARGPNWRACPRRAPCVCARAHSVRRGGEVDVLGAQRAGSQGRVGGSGRATRKGMS